MNDTVGAIVGVIAVVGLSVMRADRRGNPVHLREPPDRYWDETVPDDSPRWPDDADNDFSGR